MSNIAQSDNIIYLDHASTTPVDGEVIACMLEYFKDDYGNPSSMHTSGRKSAQALARARSEVASVLNSAPGEIIFTGSGTESDNLAILGIVRAYKKFGNHIIISAIEHKAVMAASELLEKEGFEVSIIPVNAKGLVDLEKLSSLITDKTILVSVMYVNNEIGTLQPVKEISRIVREKRKDKPTPFFHTDACQAAGYFSLDVQELGVDLLTINSSKIYGPKGAGALYKRNTMKIFPLLVGGEQEMNLRAGTENLPAIMGFTHALKKADLERGEESDRLKKIRDYFISQIKEKIPDAVVNGSLDFRSPNNIHISIPDIEGESMLLLLDDEGIQASTGSACSAFDLKPSHVLLALGLDDRYTHGSLRFSLGRSNTKRDVYKVMEILPGIAKRLKIISALTTRQYAHRK